MKETGWRGHHRVEIKDENAESPVWLEMILTISHVYKEDLK